jgi:hypothetical protein
MVLCSCECIITDDELVTCNGEGFLPPSLFFLIIHLDSLPDSFILGLKMKNHGRHSHIHLGVLASRSDQLASDMLNQPSVSRIRGGLIYERMPLRTTVF